MSSPPRTPSPMATKMTEDERHELLSRLLNENHHLQQENRRLKHNLEMLKQQVSTLSTKDDNLDDPADQQPPEMIEPEEMSKQEANDDFETKVKLFVDRQMGHEAERQLHEQSTLVSPQGALASNVGVTPLQECMESLFLSSTGSTGAALGGYGNLAQSLSSLDSSLACSGLGKLNVSVKNAHFLDNNRNAALTCLPPTYSLAGCNNRSTYLATSSPHLRTNQPKSAPTKSTSTETSPCTTSSPSSSSSSNDLSLASVNTLFDIADYMRRKAIETNEVYKIEFDDDKHEKKMGKQRLTVERKPSKESMGGESGVDSYGETEEEEEDEEEDVSKFESEELNRPMPNLDQHKWFVLPNEALATHETFFTRLQQLTHDMQTNNPQSAYRALLTLWRTTRKSVSRLTFLYHVFDFLCEKFMTVEFCHTHNPPCSPRVDGNAFRKLAIPTIKYFLQSANLSRHIIVQVEILSAIESLAYNKPKFRPAVAEIFDTLFTSGVIEAIAFSEWSSLEDPSAFFPLAQENGVACNLGASSVSISALEILDSLKGDTTKSKQNSKKKASSGLPLSPSANSLRAAYPEASLNRPTNRHRLFQELHKAGFTLLKKSYSLA